MSDHNKQENLETDLKMGLKEIEPEKKDISIEEVSGFPFKITAEGNFYYQAYLYAFATQAEVTHYVRTQALKEENDRLPVILDAWQNQQAEVNRIIQSEQFIPENVDCEPIGEKYRATIKAIESDQSFKKTFSHFQIEFCLIDIDKVIAPQRHINLDYVKQLQGRIPKEPSLDELINICISSSRKSYEVQHLEVNPNTHVFSSRNSDFRFLGAFVKDLRPEDLNFALAGGTPTGAIIVFVGNGCAPINVYEVNGRYILNNGFHRVFALRSLGITKIPVVVQRVRNPGLELPPQILGLPTQYLLMHPRPVLINDFFRPEFSILLKVKDRIKVITLGIGVNQHDVPV